MHIDGEDLKIVHAILEQYVPEYEVRAFGSRVHGRHLRKFSDLDLAVMAKERLPTLVMADLRDAFVESDLPFRVDVSEWAALPESFRHIIEEAYEVVHRPVVNA